MINQAGLKRIIIGEQSFEKLIGLNGLYIDKTTEIYRWVNRPGQYFLARPRRFGKSLMLSTMQAIFEGKRELFKGLAIDQLDYDWEKKYPVLHVSMPGLDAHEGIDLLKEKIQDMLIDFAQKRALNVARAPVDSMLRATISALATNDQKVVVLIDEYDKPLIDNIHDLKKTNEVRSVLKNFYGILKTAHANMHFLFVTGVAQFAKTSIFSELNHLSDLSMDSRTGSLLGYTDAEIDVYFTDFCHAVENGVKPSTVSSALSVREQLKLWYNGYNFHQDSVTVYNPFSVMNMLDKKEFGYYWFETGTPTFLIKLLQYNVTDFFNDQHARFPSHLLRRLEPENINFPVLLYQAGYLTLGDYNADDGGYLLKFPNLEVELAYKEVVVSQVVGRDARNLKKELVLLREYLASSDHAGIFRILKIMCANIPYSIQNPVKPLSSATLGALVTELISPDPLANQLSPGAIQRIIDKRISEQYYQTIFYMIFWLAGLNITVEDTTNIGRIDAVVETQSCFYIFELKLDQSAQIALQQIKDKKYYDPSSPRASLWLGKFLGRGKKIELVGLKFDSAWRTVTEYVHEEVG